LNTLVIRTLSGAVYVLSIIGSLWLNISLFLVVMAMYACLVLVEFATLVRLVCVKHGCSRSQLILRLILGSLLWICFPFFLMGLMPVVPWHENAEVAIPLTISMFVLTWSHDTFAYLTGRWLGRVKLVPKISPAKTVEGALGGGFMTVMLAAVVLHPIIHEFSILFWIGGAVVVTIGANFGDMAESWLKRRAGVKDSGKWMPGHGGFFDRFDALLVVAPLWYGWITLFV